MSVPANVIVIVLDSLNRHMLGAYGGREFATPNLDRFAKRALKFNRHVVGSLPCMPARHDMLCGALDFLWRPWGSVEIWEDAITYPLRKAGVVTQLISDHPHLFETGGENYHSDFAGWDYQRGHEGDAWKTRPDPSWAGAPRFGRGHMPYDNARGWFRGEADFPGPRTMAATAKWIAENAGYHKRFMLFVDEFDPHEPFDTPEPYASMYDRDWEGPHLIWPPYMQGAIAKGVLSERQGRQVRAQYGGKLTMIDAWFGRVLDEMEAANLWEDSAVFVCTDHGHYLGEKDCWGKPAVPIYDTLGHIPLLVAWPGQAPREIEALTTSVDLYATLAEVFGVSTRQRTHGRSLVPLITGKVSSVRDWALMGVWGREVHITDGRWKYARAPVGRNEPLAMLSNRWSTMPTHVLARERELPLPDQRAVLGRMPGSTVPVIKQVWDASDNVPFWAWAQFTGHHLFDLANDPGENDNRAGSADEGRMIELLRGALSEVEAPAEQFVRLGLS
ncbi:MAG: sulfatase [Alphaproteobacteria bacterium]|nr:sulfatase [Alphaproteobacteria bacterium]